MYPYQATLNSPIGRLGIRTNQQSLTNIDFLPSNAKPIKPSDPFTQSVLAQLNHYFVNPNHVFTLASSLTTTPFQQRVLTALQALPRDATITYGELAKQLNTSARAIGNACRANPIPIVIPCHLVVAQNDLGGYAGEKTGRNLSIKQWLLQHEGCR